MRELSIFAAAREAPSRDCFVADGRASSYSDVARRVGAAIRTLTAKGVQSGDRVAVTPRADASSAVWLYALFELGCPAVLLHPSLTERERDAVLKEAAPSLVIAEEAPRGHGRAAVVATIPEDRTLAVVYTSGSRGASRGAKLSRRAFVASEAAHAANLGWLPQDRWLLGMPPAHVGGLSILTRCLIARRCVVFDSGSFDPARTIETMERESVTLLSVVPTMLARLLAIEDPPWRPSPALRAVLVGGAAFPESLRKSARAKGLPVLSTYGCTEACSQVTTQTLAQAGLPGSGAPLPGIEVRIRDDEIQVRGETLMQGYLGARRADEPWTEDGWLRTGDFGAFAPDGQLVVLGRLDDVIVTGGENVAPQEVEEWLQSMPGVVAACVFGVEDEEWGQRVVAAVVTEKPLHDPTALRNRMRTELAPYKRPKSFAMLDALPLNRSGKVDRAKVRALAEPSLGFGFDFARVDAPESATVRPSRGDDMAEQINASHILLMYAGSERSRATRSKDEAHSQIADIAQQLEGGGDFAALARSHSDCGSAQAGGDLGTFGRGQMVKAFEDAAFGLNVGDTSSVIETPFGFHIIRRTG